MQLSDFHYTLPPELIARYPLKTRSASRLLHVDSQGNITHHSFTDLLQFITEKDLLVFNNSKVIPARLRGHKETGGRVEILIERILDNKQILVHLRASKTPAIGSCLYFGGNFQFTVVERRQELFVLQCDSTLSVLDIIEQLGEVPLPPYMHREAEEMDK